MKKIKREKRYHSPFEEGFFLTRKKMEQDTGFSPSKQRKMENKLIELGLLDVKNINGKNCYALNHKKLLKIMGGAK